MTPNYRARLQSALDAVDAQIAPLMHRRADLARLIEQPNDPIDTEVEAAEAAYREAEEVITRWQRDQEMCDGLDDGPPMRIPDSVFRDCDEARARLRRAQEAQRRRDGGQ
jgi:hypothetical protein